MSKRINNNDATVTFPVELSTELVDDLTQPIIEVVQCWEDDEPAKAIIKMIRVLAHEEDHAVRESFAADLAAKIFAQTSAVRDAALAFS